MPILILDDGTKLNQSQAILRYVGRAYTTKSGDCLYPGATNPELTYQIDDVMCINEELLPKYIGFLVPFLPMYKDKDEHA